MGVTLVKDALKYTQKCDLDHTHYDMRQGVGAQEMTIAEYTHFALDKFKSLSSTLWYNGLPLITFDYAFHTFLTKLILVRIFVLVIVCSLDCNIHQ